MQRLTLDEADRRHLVLTRIDEERHPKAFELDGWRTLLDAVWAPIPWMLEAVFVLLFALGDYTGMTTVAVLLGFNVILGFNGAINLRRARAAAPRDRKRR